MVGPRLLREQPPHLVGLADSLTSCSPDTLKDVIMACDLLESIPAGVRTVHLDKHLRTTLPEQAPCTSHDRSLGRLYIDLHEVRGAVMPPIHELVQRDSLYLDGRLTLAYVRLGHPIENPSKSTVSPIERERAHLVAHCIRVNMDGVLEVVGTDELAHHLRLVTGRLEGMDLASIRQMPGQEQAEETHMGTDIVGDHAVHTEFVEQLLHMGLVAA